MKVFESNVNPLQGIINIFPEKGDLLYDGKLRDRLAQELYSGGILIECPEDTEKAIAVLIDIGVLSYREYSTNRYLGRGKHGQ